MIYQHGGTNKSSKVFGWICGIASAISLTLIGLMPVLKINIFFAIGGNGGNIRSTFYLA
jgi:hypothetical protein